MEIGPDLDRDHDPHDQARPRGLRVGDEAHSRKMTGTWITKKRK